MAKTPARVVFAARLRESRNAVGLSQAELGRRVGIPEEVASTRVNRYERGKHQPDFETMEAMAKELGVPVPYLFAQDERLAQVIREFAELAVVDQKRVLAALEEVRKNPTPAKAGKKAGAAKKAKVALRPR